MNWEYETLMVDQGEFPEGFDQWTWIQYNLQLMGDQGWELVTWNGEYQDGHALFKRPKSTDNEVDPESGYREMDCS